MRPSAAGRTWALALALALASAAPHAQPLPATLLADTVRYDREAGRLVASGNVEVLYEGRVLRARRIVYDERAGEIRAEGPITVTDPDGGVMVADAAALTPDLAEGLVEGARLLIAGELQLAAVEVQRRGGRYTSLYKTVASSCTICSENPTPTWAIRASRVTQDAEARRIYFEDARLELFGLPIGYLPRLSIPEPGVERASGLLIPEFLSSEIYGFGVKLPYYRVLGPSADLTLTPFVTTGGAALVEGEYRRRLARGGFDLAGSLALDDGDGGAGRGFAAAVGAFDLGSGFALQFDGSVVSDDTFLQEFDYSDADQLTSFARVQRTLATEFVSLGAIGFQSLREDEDTSTVPFVLPEFTWRRLFSPPGVGGRLGVDANALGLTRERGVNEFRFGGGLDWRRDEVLPHGILAAATAGLGLQAWRVWQDPDAPESLLARADPSVSVELRWPFVQRGGAAAHVIEPIAQVIWSDAFGRDVDEIPNEDSLLPEFDDTNLFSLNRFPGLDRVETGLRANLGVSYTRLDPAGWSLGLTAGRVVRAEADPEFAEGTGLAGRWSDWVAALSLDFGWGLGMVNRALFEDNLDFRRNEFAMLYDGQRAGLRAAYVYLAEDDSNPAIGPQPTTDEFAVDGRYRVLPNWEVRGLWRYDLEADNTLRAGAGVTYGNECAEFDLSVSRRYTSSASLPPATSFAFSLRLAGFGATAERDWPPRVCMGG